MDRALGAIFEISTLQRWRQEIKYREILSLKRGDVCIHFFSEFQDGGCWSGGNSSDNPSTLVLVQQCSSFCLIGTRHVYLGIIGRSRQNSRLWALFCGGGGGDGGGVVMLWSGKRC